MESPEAQYLNPALPTEQRVDDLISRMTLEEKASQLVNQARAIPRLKVPAYDWWSESLHGVAVNGTTFQVSYRTLSLSGKWHPFHAWNDSHGRPDSE